MLHGGFARRLRCGTSLVLAVRLDAATSWFTRTVISAFTSSLLLLNLIELVYRHLRISSLHVVITIYHSPPVCHHSYEHASRVCFCHTKRIHLVIMFCLLFSRSLLWFQ